MKITITEFGTLDGVCQGPGSATEDTTDGFTRGGWLVHHIDGQFVRQASEWLDLADGLLLGRRTYEAFARDWPQITDPDDPFTERMNALPKYVVTTTLTEGTWHPTTVLRGNPVHTVGALRSRPGRELQVHGSARLGAALLAAGLVDALRLVVAPTIIGSGRRLLVHPSEGVGLRLVHQETTSTGLLLLEYGRSAPRRSPTTGACPLRPFDRRSSRRGRCRRRTGPYARQRR
jgi:dihydrofolate reductase